MTQMISPITRTNSHIINIRISIGSDRLQNRTHGSDESSTGVLQPERHPDPFVETVVGHDRGKPSVLGRDGDLPISRLGVERTAETPATDAPYDLVDGRHWIGVTDSIFVQVSVVDGRTYAAVTFGHAHDRAGHGTVGWADESHLEQLGDPVDLLLEHVRHAVGSYLPRHELRRRTDAMDCRLAHTRLVAEPVGELVE